MKIEVLGWEKFNPRSDYHCHWFRVENNIFANEDFAELDAAEWTVFFYILCRTSQKQGKSWELKVNFVSRQTGCSEKTIKSALEKLQENQIVRIRSSSITQYNTEHNNTEQNNTKHKNTKDAERPKNSVALATLSTLPPPFDSPELLDFFLKAGIKQRTVALWYKTYGDADWLVHEIHKAIAWLDANPQRRPKTNFARFLANWFSRGWERHRKTMPSNKAGDVGFSKSEKKIIFGDDYDD